MDLLKQLYCIHSPFYREWPMICFIREYIRQHVPEADVQMDSWGNLYVVKGEDPTDDRGMKTIRAITTIRITLH